jgi:hypothetical protein
LRGEIAELPEPSAPESSTIGQYLQDAALVERIAAGEDGWMWRLSLDRGATLDALAEHHGSSTAGVGSPTAGVLPAWWWLENAGGDMLMQSVALSSQPVNRSLERYGETKLAALLTSRAMDRR